MVEPAVDIPVSKLGINSFEFDLSFNELTITITLERPGLMIGKGGKTIFELEKFLSTREYCVPVKLQLKDSKLWY